MLGNYNLQESVDEILASEDVCELSHIELTGNMNREFDEALHILKDVGGNGKIRSERGVVVRGSVKGTAQRWVEIHSDGDVVILGSVEYANISGRNIRIGEEAKACTLSGREGVECGDDVQDARVEIGRMGPEKKEIDYLMQKLKDIILDRDTKLTQLKLEQKRIYRHFESTRINFDFSMSTLIRKRHNHIDVDLRPFYLALGECSEEKKDLALRGFYAKGVVGLLTRLNRDFLNKNRHRQRIFSGFIKDLYHLFKETRDIDKKKQAILDLEKDLRLKIDILNHRPCRMCVKGRIYPSLRLKLFISELEIDTDGKLIPDRKTLTFELNQNEDGTLAGNYIDANGKDEHLMLGPEQLQDIALGAFENELSIGKIGARESMVSLVT